MAAIKVLWKAHSFFFCSKRIMDVLKFRFGRSYAMLDSLMPRSAQNTAKQLRYVPPLEVRTIGLANLLEQTGRGALKTKQLALLKGLDGTATDSVSLFFSGDISLLDRPSVAVVGSRKVSAEGRARATRLARELVDAGFVVVSGLAEGVDQAAHLSAIQRGGNTVGVIGTPLERAYPAQNAGLQQQIYAEHLLVSPFQPGERTYPSSFPKRNRVMAAITDATVIIEASDTSGTLHQAAECAQLGRWLFIARSLADNPDLSWPKKFLAKGKTRVLVSTKDLVDEVIAAREISE